MSISERDRKMALQCLTCPVCRYGRKRQKGLVFWFLQRIEGRVCPFCRAFERVTGQKAHEPITREAIAKIKMEAQDP